MQSTDLIAVAFGLFNALRLVSYFPQIVAVARDRHGAQAISVSCWSIWIGANASAALYSWVNIGDAVMALTMAFNAICCTTVVTLALCKRAARWSYQNHLGHARSATRPPSIGSMRPVTQRDSSEAR
jgi:hypothetical protein